MGFVGWWVTWPAEKVNGFMVSDHFSITRFNLNPSFEDVRNEKFYDRQTYPEDLYERIAHLKYARTDVGPDDPTYRGSIDETRWSRTIRPINLARVPNS